MKHPYFLFKWLDNRNFCAGLGIGTKIEAAKSE